MGDSSLFFLNSNGILDEIKNFYVLSCMEFTHENIASHFFLQMMVVPLFAESYVASAVFVTVGVYYRSKIEIKLSEESFNCSVLTRIVGHL